MNLNPPAITVNGHPPIFDWMSNEEKRFRAELINTLRNDSICRRLGLDSTAIHIDFETGGGEECVTAFLTLNNCEAVLLKSCRIKGMLKTESYFLKSWSEHVWTPKILRLINGEAELEGEILLMERVQGLTAAQAFPNRLPNEISTEMGQTLAMMHSVKGKGFGRPVINGDVMIGSYSTLHDEVMHELNRRLRPLVDSGLVDHRVHDRINESLHLLSEDLASTEPSLTHCDFKTDNVLVSDDGRLTVIDPNCRITHPSMCLAASLLQLYCGTIGGEEAASRFLEGYRSIVSIKDDVLNAGLLLRGLLTLSTWLRKKKMRQIDLLKECWSQHGVSFGSF